MPLFRKERRSEEEVPGPEPAPDPLLTRTVENTQWVKYKIPMAEFKRRLGITDPENVLLVTTDWRTVEITMSKP